MELITTAPARGSSVRMLGAWWCRLLGVVCVLAFACFVPAPAAAAEDVSAADAKAIRAVIEAQIAAFQADDAVRAFSYAAPGIRELFGNADAFMSMVRRSYPVVYRPKSVLFLAPQRAGSDVIQPVRMTDAGGRGWLAVYELQRQADGAWRIAGCRAMASEARTV